MILETQRLPILETRVLRLTPLGETDGDLLFQMMTDRDVMAHWDWPRIDDPELAAAILRGVISAMQGGRAIHWVIRRLDDGAPLGLCDLSEIDRRHRRAELGFLMTAPAWAEGHAAEALRPVIAYGASSGLRRLATNTHLGDRRAEGLLRDQGFRDEGLLRGHLVREGERRDGHLFGLAL
jgi:ribosomal-protein-alanine N-acetyltransferase